jgi:hypothetical protein
MARGTTAERTILLDLSVGRASSGSGIRAVLQRLRSSFSDGLSGILKDSRGGTALKRVTAAGLAARGGGSGIRSSIRNMIDVRA